MTRLLVAGTGLIGARHLTHIETHPRLDLAGVVEPLAERRVDGVPGFARLEDVDVAVDGIVLATPTDTHAELTCAAAARGWHVLVEKPLAGSLAEADTMIAAVETAGVAVLVGHHRRHHPRAQALKQVIDSGRIGHPLAAALMWCLKKPDDYFLPAWRAGRDGGPVLQNLIHEVDLLRWYFGEVTEVTGLGSNAVRGADRTESGGAVLRFSSGTIVTVVFSDAAPSPWGFEAGTGENPHIATTGQDSLRVVGTQGAVEFPSLTVWTGSDSWHEAPVARTLDVAPGVPLIRQLEHFAEVIAGRAAPVVDARSGRATLAAVLEIEAQCLPQPAPGNGGADGG